MMSMRQLGTVALVVWMGAGSTGVTQVSPERAYRPVTDAMLANPDPADWLHWRRTLDGWGYSPLDQINRENVDRLQLVWSWAMTPGLSQTTPLVHDGILYLPNPLNVVQALDAVTGELIWEYRKAFDGDPEASFRARTRSIAIYDDKIYLATNDAHIVALDARTGAVVWDRAVADHRLGYRYTSGPIVVSGRIVAGMTGCERYKDGTCFISAHDAATGEESWRTSTTAMPGEPGGDTWGDLPAEFRAGGDAWIPGSYDPETGLTYWSTSQAKPWARVSRGTDGDALYTNSVLALAPDTGRLEWYYQFIPGETHDLDEVFESVLINHRGRRSLFKMGKLGILWEIDRTTGAFVAAHDLGYQTLVDVDPATGRTTYRADMIPRDGVELEFCPDFLGVRNWRAAAYHPETQALYIPIHPTCVRGTFSQVAREKHPAGALNFYANPEWTGWRTEGSVPHPAVAGHEGELIAMDIETGQVSWRHEMRTRPTAAALATGGGLVVTADADRYLYVLDARSGRRLFQTRLPAPVEGFPITYAVDGRQYLAAPVAGGRVPGASNALYVFAVPPTSPD